MTCQSLDQGSSLPGLCSRGRQRSGVPHLANVGGCQSPQLGCVHFVLELVRGSGWAQPEDPGTAGKRRGPQVPLCLPHSPAEETESTPAGTGGI